MKEYKFDFRPLAEPSVGCSYSKYWSYAVRKYGRWLFKYAIQELPEDLPKEPWWND